MTTCQKQVCSRHKRFFQSVSVPWQLKALEVLRIRTVSLRLSWESQTSQSLRVRTCHVFSYWDACSRRSNRPLETAEQYCSWRQKKLFQSTQGGTCPTSFWCYSCPGQGQWPRPNIFPFRKLKPSYLVFLASAFAGFTKVYILPGHSHAHAHSHDS